jgi:hypothetical protein
LEGPWQRKTDMTFSKWNIRSLYRTGNLSSLTNEMEKLRMDLVGEQIVEWEGNDTLELYFFSEEC